MLYEQEAAVGQRGGVSTERQQVHLALVLRPWGAAAEQERHVHFLHFARRGHG